MFDKELEIVLEHASLEARQRGHEFVCLEHLLYALIKNPQVKGILESVGADIRAINNDLLSFFSTKLERMSEAIDYSPHPTLGFQRVLQRVVLHAQYSSAEKVSSGDVLAGICTETESHAAYFIHKQGISRLDILEVLSHGLESDVPGLFESEPDQERSTKKKESALEKFCVHLNKKAKDGLIEPLIGREKELERTIQVLCRRTKNNPLFVGDQGVGKTALAEGLALRIHEKKVPKALYNTDVYALDLTSMLAGTKFRGDFEKRVKSVLSELEKKKGSILFIDEIHTIVGAGATSGGTMDAANMLKPVLTSGNLRVLGSTTFEEYKNTFEKDRALARRFLKIDVKEPSVSETIEILKGLKKGFEEHHRVRYAANALSLAAELSSKYLHERFLPDKAIDVIDEAGALVRLSQEQKKDDQTPTVKTSHIEQVIAKMAQVPPRTVNSSEKEKLLELEPRLKRVVFGQDEALEQVIKAIRRSRAGLATRARPIGSFLFAGPTGVGKTEVAKQLAEVLGLSLIRFDMSEYMEKHTVARLIGAPPGYVGFDQGGLLTDAIIKTPHAVLLLDEIEKAHPDLFNVLLQVMDNASLTDTNGRRADFRNVILIMTSNAGSENMFSQAIGFGANTPEVGQGVINKAFRPEFRNRLDAIVKFKALAPEVIEQVVDKFITELDARLVEKKASITITSKAKKWIATQGYDTQFGARSVYRLIQSEVNDKLADAILFGELQNGGLVTIDSNESGLVFNFEAKKISKREKATDTEEVA